MIKELKKALRGHYVYAKVESVAKSGMSRKVRFYITRKNHIVEVTHWLRVIKDLKSMSEAEMVDLILASDWDYSPITLRGCGLDVIGHFLSNIGKKFGKPYQLGGWYYGRL